MTTKHLLDPEVAPAPDVFPEISLTRELLSMIRQAASAAQGLVDISDFPVTREEVTSLAGAAILGTQNT